MISNPSNPTPVAKILHAKRDSFRNKIHNLQRWTSSQSTMHGVTPKKIRTMLHQILKELQVDQGVRTLNQIYAFDFDASRCIRLIDTLRRGHIVDVLHKDFAVVAASVDIFYDVLTQFQLATTVGTCLFVQLILAGARNEFDGFGTSENLVEKWKRQSKKRKAPAKIPLPEPVPVPVPVKTEPISVKKDPLRSEIQLEIPDSWECHAF